MKPLLLIAGLLLLFPSNAANAQNCNLVGTWEVFALTLTETDGTINEIEISDPPGLKILSETHWVFVEQNHESNPIPTSGGGGRYKAEGSTYTELVQYHASRDFIGKTISFDCKVEDDFWYQSGVLPGGTMLEEVYKRAGK